MTKVPVVCPVCGAREELTARTPEEVKALVTCALPSCPHCGWAREEDRSSPVWERLDRVYLAHLDGQDFNQSMLDRLERGAR